jgi:DNA (cytosine-5)-methyltransferase 1
VIKTGSDFSGVGAFDQALQRLGIEQDKKFACDMDKYARQTYIYNFGEPEYYPVNVYDREIPSESLDIYMTSPPCQAFSLAGKRKGEEDKRGVLFYNSHEFIQKNKPRFFIFENVKGLLSDDKGKTFQTWCDYLGGKSINGNPVIFPHEESVSYHIYYKVLNAKHYNIPQNRERVFIVGIRDDEDNNFRWSKPMHLEKRLKDVLENNVDEKYYLSDKNIKALMVYNNRQKENGTGFSAKFRDVDTVDTMDALKVGGGGKDDLIKVKSATKKGYERAEIGDSINLEFPDSETRRGRVGKGVAQTLDTGCKQGVVTDKIRRLTPLECFRLMDFNESFKWNVSDTQAYKQAGNSICVGVLVGIINNLNL